MLTFYRKLHIELSSDQEIEDILIWLNTHDSFKLYEPLTKRLYTKQRKKR